jgi:hypothetical protein
MKSMCHDVAAELAVRRRLEPDLLLPAHDLADRLVLDAAQRVGVDAPGREGVARLVQLGRPEQRPDVVGPVGRLRPRACRRRRRLLLHLRAPPPDR